MLWSDTSPNINSSKIRSLKPGTIALLRTVMNKRYVPWRDYAHYGWLLTGDTSDYAEQSRR